MNFRRSGAYGTAVSFLKNSLLLFSALFFARDSYRGGDLGYPPPPNPFSINIIWHNYNKIRHCTIFTFGKDMHMH